MLFAVAVTELRGDLDTEAQRLADLLGLSPYDVKARLTGPLPKVLVQSDEETARRVHRDVVSRGHGAVLCDPASVVPSAQMVRFHRFTLEPSGVWANDRAGDRLAWADLGVIVVALLRSQVARTKEEIEFQATVPRTPGSGKHAATKTELTSTHAAYLFPHSRAPSSRPWLFEEATAQFTALGPKMEPTRRANFVLTMRLIRRMAPNVVVDDRFVAGPLVVPGLIHVRGNDYVPPVIAAGQAEVTIHVLASWLMRERGGPYRG
jgi:hypothetical protein